MGECGVRLSAGQPQRTALSRTILRDQTLLILDEATSALDASSEKEVQMALDTLMRGRSSLIIAHRLSTIKSADKIAVLSNGSIVELGQHEDLLAQKGPYHALVKNQEVG